MTTTEEARAEIARLHRSLTNITPSAEQIDRIEMIREHAKDLGTALLAANPNPSRERSLAVTKLEEAVMWGVKAILVNEPTQGETS